MILSEIKSYLSENRRMTLGDLSVHFDIEPDAMRGMLEQWIRKGRVRKHTAEGGCKSACCSGCDAVGMEIYEWVH